MSGEGDDELHALFSNEMGVFVNMKILCAVFLYPDWAIGYNGRQLVICLL